MKQGTLISAGATSAIVPASNVRWRIFGIIFALVVINLVDRVALSIAMPTISTEFGLDPAMRGVILSAFFWTYAGLQIPLGWLIDRYGPRKVIGAATVLWGLCQALAALATGGYALMATRFGLGAAEAPLFPAGGKLNSIWLSARERGRGAVLMDCGGPLGTAIGGITISYLIINLGSWRLAFLVAGIATMALGLVAWWYLRDDPRDHAGVDTSELAHIQDRDLPKMSGASQPGSIAGRSLAGLLIGRAGWTMIFFGLVTWGPSYLSEARGFDLKQIGWATFAIFFVGTLGSLFGGFTADYLTGRGLGRAVVLKAMLAFSGIMTVGAFLLLPHVPDALSAVGLLSATVFFVMWGSLYWSFPALLAPKDKVGLIGSIMNFAGSCSGILIPLIIGFILQFTGKDYQIVLYFFAGCAAVFVTGTLLIDLGGSSSKVMQA